MREKKTYDQIRVMEGFRQGYETAFALLFQELYPSLTGYAQRITGNQEFAEEIAGEIFLKAWERRDTFHEFKPLCAWLYASIRNASIDWLRHQQVAQNANTVIRERYEDMETTALENLVRAEVLRELGQALDRLPTQQQKIVRAFYIEEQSLQDIADQMRLSIHTVKSQKARGLAFLRKIMNILTYLSLLGKFIE